MKAGYFERTGINFLCISEGKENGATKELFKVLKDHQNPLMEELVNSCYQYWFRDEFEKFRG